ncbi:MAG: SRPBCC domain-containing protein [Sphingorhabdus sp.]
MTATDENGWALSVSRYIAAPPDKVWDAMTKRQAEWWCPKPWKTEIVEQKWHAGGRSAVIMHGPDGETSPQEGIFLEVTLGVRFVSTDAFVRTEDGEILPHVPFMVGCWEIAPEGNGTRYTATARHWSKADAKHHAEMGFVQGWGTCADQLAALAET